MPENWREPPGGNAAMHDPVTPLTARMVNCLQTILELEPMLGGMELGRFLLPEFCALKEFLHGLDGASLDEEDVSRIESATERFLHELMPSVPCARMDAWKNRPLQ